MSSKRKKAHKSSENHSVRFTPKDISDARKLAVNFPEAVFVSRGCQNHLILGDKDRTVVKVIPLTANMLPSIKANAGDFRLDDIIAECIPAAKPRTNTVTVRWLDSDRYPFFSTKREYFEEYISGKQSNRDLAYRVGSKMAAENARLEADLEKVRGFQQQHEEYEAIMSVLNKHGIHKWYGEDIAKELDKKLSRTCLEDISYIRQSAEIIVNQLKRIEEARKEGTAE